MSTYPLPAPAPSGILRLPRLSRGGAQVALFLLVPALRRLLPAEQVRGVVRAAGMRLAIVAGVALPTIAVTGVALGRHEPAREHHLTRRVVIAAVRQRVTIGDHHRNQAGIMLEALPDQLICAFAADGANLVLARAAIE